LNFTKTELSADASSGASTITVDSITGISSGDNIGVQLDTGSLQWTTVNGAPAGSTVTLTDVLTSDADENAFVYAYTTGIQRPLDVRDVRIRLNDQDGQDVPLFDSSRSEYNDLSTKETEGKATQVYFDPQLVNAKLFVWPTADSVKDTLRFTMRRPIFDMDGANNTADVPPEWQETLIYNLAVRLAPRFQVNLSAIPDVVNIASSTMEALMSHDEESVSFFIKRDAIHRRR
jgi:hypothetical protein